MQKLTIGTDAHQTFKSNLNGQNVEISLSWVDSSNSWFISIYDVATSQAYIINRRLNNNILLFNHFTNDFVGDIIAFSTSTPDETITRDSFTNIYNLYYLTPDEVLEATRDETL